MSGERHRPFNCGTDGCWCCTVSWLVAVVLVPANNNCCKRASWSSMLMNVLRVLGGFWGGIFLGLVCDILSDLRTVVARSLCWGWGKPSGDTLAALFRWWGCSWDVVLAAFCFWCGRSCSMASGFSFSCACSWGKLFTFSLWSGRCCGTVVARYLCTVEECEGECCEDWTCMCGPKWVAALFLCSGCTVDDDLDWDTVFLRRGWGDGVFRGLSSLGEGVVRSFSDLGGGGGGALRFGVRGRLPKEDTLELRTFALGLEDTLELWLEDTLELRTFALGLEDTLELWLEDTLELHTFSLGLQDTLELRTFSLGLQDTLELWLEDTLELRTFSPGLDRAAPFGRGTTPGSLNRLSLGISTIAYGFTIPICLPSTSAMRCMIFCGSDFAFASGLFSSEDIFACLDLWR